MSAYGEELKNLLTKTWDGESYRIVPQFRGKETLSLIEQGLEDVSFSRPRSSLTWGVPVPGDDEQTMYVWCDALTNYISGLGLLTSHSETEWWDDATVTHVIGKDIARFHALIWPLMLKKAGVRTPDELLIHGFLTSEGQKMSKSLGNVVVPDDILKKFDGNPDPLRFYLSAMVPVGRDGDFSWKQFEELYDARMRNDLGNLLNRVLVLLKKEGGALSAFGKDPGIMHSTWNDYTDCMKDYEVSLAATHAISVATRSNVYISEKQPWTLEGDEKMIILTQLAEALRHTALLLLPFIPHTAYRISTQLHVPYAAEMLSKEFVITEQMKQWGGTQNWVQIGEPEILFPSLEEEEVKR